MDLLLDFVNHKGWSISTLAGFYQKHRIYYSVAGGKRGWEDRARVRGDERFWCLTDEAVEISKDLKKVAPDYFVSPDEGEKWSDLWKRLEGLQGEYRLFLDKCIKGELDLGFLNNRIQQVRASSGLDFELVADVNPWTPFTFWRFYEGTLEDAIETRGLIRPFLYGEGERFSRIRKCPECGKYFEPKSLKARYCSVSCKNAANYRALKK